MRTQSPWTSLHHNANTDLYVFKQAKHCAVNHIGIKHRGERKSFMLLAFWHTYIILTVNVIIHNDDDVKEEGADQMGINYAD